MPWSNEKVYDSGIGKWYDAFQPNGRSRKAGGLVVIYLEILTSYMERGTSQVVWNL